MRTPVRSTACCVPFFQYMTEHPDRHAIYDAAMMIHGVAETYPMLDAYDFSGFQTVADIGGGNGHMLAAILEIATELERIGDYAKGIARITLKIEKKCWTPTRRMRLPAPSARV